MTEYSSELDPVTSGCQSQQNLLARVSTLTPAQQSLHNNLLESVKSLKKAWIRAVYFLAAINNQKIHRLLGFSSIGDYAQESVGFSPKMTTEILKLAKNLPEFPLVAEALKHNQLSWRLAREICSSTDPADQEKWLEAASRLPRKALRAAMARSSADPKSDHRPLAIKKETPGLFVPTLKTVSPKSCAEEYHFLTFKFTSEQKARWEKLVEHFQKNMNRTKEDLVLGALHDSCNQTNSVSGTGHPAYLVVLLECPTCGAATMPTNRGEIPVASPLLQSAHCDAIVEDLDNHRRSVIPPRLRRQAFRRARYSCEAIKCGNTQFLEIHHKLPTAQGGTNSLENLAVLCWSCHRALHEAEEAAGQVLKEAP